MITSITNRVILAPELRRRLGMSHSEQFRRELPELAKFGAFQLTSGRWRMYEDDFNRYLAARRSEAASKLERRAK